MQFDPDTDPDVDNVLKAAALLDTSEINVFRIAYGRWFGDRPAVGLVEKAFVRYMFRDHVPVWVRDFTRQIVRRSLSENIDPAEFGIQEPAPTPRLVLLGRLYVAALLIVGALLMFVSLGYDYPDLLAVIRHCYFPPCY